jgi:hypothetical protein
MMINPIQIRVPQADGSDRYVIIEPILENDAKQSLRSTGVFKIYKDASGDETHFLTESMQSDGSALALPDDKNPDYLGEFVFEEGSVKHFDGQVLSVAEPAYLAVFIETYQEPDF